MDNSAKKHQKQEKNESAIAVFDSAENKNVLQAGFAYGRLTAF